MFVIYIIQKKIHIKKIIPPFSAPFPKKKMANTKTPALNCLEASSAVIPTLTCNVRAENVRNLRFQSGE